jgi:heme ABC exporter ATP-binding subunit CcmA
MNVIAASSLMQRYGSDLALDSVDVTLGSGEHLAVLGENGAGKTTLLRILATAARPTAGSVEIFGLNALTEKRKVRSRIGYAGHAPGLYPALTVAENLEFFRTLYGVGHGRIADVLDLVGLGDVADRYAGKLSRGAQQRLALARAVLHDPELLVLDEPDASLDSGAADLLARAMRGRAAIIATHDHALATRLCQRSMELRRGRVVVTPTRLRAVQ